MASEKKVLKMGVVGLGRGRLVMSDLIKDDNVVLTAICDKNPIFIKESQEHFKKENNLDAADYKTFESYEEFLKSDIEAVFVCTDATVHTGHVIQALEAGKHVISEIPTINTLEDAKKLKAAVKSHPELKYMTGENCCYWAFIEEWKKMHEDGKFGDIVYAEAEYLHGHDFKDFYHADGTPKTLSEYGYLKDGHWRIGYHAIKYITHSLGPLLHIMNDRCVSVTCYESDIKYNPFKTGTESAVALLKTEKGAMIKILIAFGAYVGADHNYRILGTKGSIQTDTVKSLETAHSFASISETPGTLEEKMEIPITLKQAGDDNIGHGGADVKMMREFVKSILNDTKPPLDVDFGINISLPGICAHESAVKGGMPVEIPVID